MARFGRVLPAGEVGTAHSTQGHTVPHSTAHRATQGHTGPHGRQPGVTAGWPLRPLWEAPAAAPEV